MEHTMRQGWSPRQGSRPTKKPLSAARRAFPWLIIINHLGLSLGSALSFIGAPCDFSGRFWPVDSSSLHQQRRPRRACSSSPTTPTPMASTSVWPRARSAVRMRPAPIANHAILHRPLLSVASIPTKLPVRCRETALIARMAGATNTSPSPASDNGKVPATSAPRKRRDAAARSSYWRRPRLIGLADSLLAGHA